MTKTQFKKRVASMKKDINRYLDKETIRLFDCGGIDKNIYEDNYLLPKIILTVALQNLSPQYHPHSVSDKGAVKNLKQF